MQWTRYDGFSGGSWWCVAAPRCFCTAHTHGDDLAYPVAPPSHPISFSYRSSHRLASPRPTVLCRSIPSHPIRPPKPQKKEQSSPPSARSHARTARTPPSFPFRLSRPPELVHARTHAHMHAGRPLGPPRACVAGRTGMPPFSRWYHAYRKGCAGSAWKGRLEGMGWVSHRFWAVVDRWREGVG